MEHLTLSNLKAILKLYRGFLRNPQWLRNQAPIEFHPKFKAALLILADFTTKRYKLGPGSMLEEDHPPYYLHPDDAQLAEMRIAAELGPIRTDSFIDGLILAFVHPSSETRLAQLLGREMDLLGYELYLQQVTDDPEEYYLQSVFPDSFVEEKLAILDRLETDTLASLLRAAAANNNLEHCRILWPKLKERYYSEFEIDFEDLAGDPNLQEGHREIGKLLHYSAINLGLFGKASFEVIEYLVETHYPLYLHDETCLSALSQSREPRLIELFLQHTPYHPAQVDSVVYLEACMRGDLRMIKALIKHEFRLNHSQTDLPPLFWSLIRGFDQVSAILIRNKASLALVFSHAYEATAISLEHSMESESSLLKNRTSLLDLLTSRLSDLALTMPSILEPEYRFQEMVFTDALLETSQSGAFLEDIITLCNIECCFWVLATFDKFKAHQYNFKRQRIDQNHPKPIELFWIDLNQLFYHCLNQLNEEALITKLLIELGKRESFCALSWQSLAPLAMRLDPHDSFGNVLQWLDVFDEHDDGYVDPWLLCQCRPLDAAENSTAALFFASMNHFDHFEILLMKQRSLILWQSQMGDSLLSLAIMAGRPEMIRPLVAAGANLTESLHYAIMARNFYLVEYLLFWLVRKMIDNDKPYYQELVHTGLDLSTLFQSAKQSNSRKMTEVFLTWLHFFPAHLNLFVEGKEHLPISELTQKDLRLKPKELNHRLQEELLNPNHQSMELQRLEFDLFLYPRYRFTRLLEEGKIKSGQFFHNVKDGLSGFGYWPEDAPSNEEELSLIYGDIDAYFAEKDQISQLPPNDYDHQEKALSMDGHWLALLHKNQVSLLDLFSHELHQITEKDSELFAMSESEALEIHFFDKGQKLLIVNMALGFEAWCLKSFKPLYLNLEYHQAEFSSYFIGQESLLLLTNWHEHILWDLNRNEERSKWIEQNSMVQPLAFDQGKLVTLNESTWGGDTYYRICYWQEGKPTPTHDRAIPYHMQAHICQESLQAPRLYQPIFFGSSQQNQGEASFLDLQSESFLNFKLNQPHQFFSQSANRKYALISNGGHLTLLNLEEQSSETFWLDSSFIEDAMIAHKNRYFVFHYRPDPFRDLPGKLLVWNWRTKKTLYEEELMPWQKVFFFEHDELFALQLNEKTLKVFDLTEMGYVAKLDLSREKR